MSADAALTCGITWDGIGFCSLMSFPFSASATMPSLMQVMMGGQVGVAGHIQVADGSKVGAKSGITKSLKTPNQTWHGNPAIDFTASMRQQAYTRQLPDLEKRIAELEKMVRDLANMYTKP
jgi:hypothetical protein